MNAPKRTTGTLFFAMYFIVSPGITSCNQSDNPASPAANDSISVKKMGTDSNSDMPVAIPKDSTARIPNPYDSTKK